jgi:predicted amidohydrolase YtcJ
VVGRLADMVVLDENPLTVEAMSITDIQVLETIKEAMTPSDEIRYVTSFHRRMSW